MPLRKNTLLVIVAIFFLPVFLEGTCYLLNSSHIKYTKKNTNQSPFAMRPDNSKLDRSGLAGYTESKPGGIMLPKKNVSLRSVLRLKTGEPVYDITYHTDDNRRRVVPGQEKSRNKHALLIGCSATYGEGVEDNQTIQFHLSQTVPNYRVYNFAYHAYGINDIFARMRYDGEDYWAGVKEQEGTAIYLFHYDHMRRLLGTMNYLGWYGGPHPYLEEYENQIVSRGTFAEAKPWLIPLYSFLRNLQIVKFFRLDFPAKFSPDHWRFFARVVNEVKKDYLKRFPKGKFLVFSMPRTVEANNQADPYLKKLGLNHVDYSSKRLEDLVQGPTYLTPDVHFTPTANQVLGKLISKHL